MTQLGFIRLSSNPAMARQIVTAADAALLLRRMIQDPQHLYLPDNQPAATVITNLLPRILGHQQVTDAYLLAMAAANQARFVTFDKRIQTLAEGVCELEVLI